MIRLTRVLSVAFAALTLSSEATVFSVLGDSYSTFEGVIPEGNACYYCKPPHNRTDVTDVRQMWWSVLEEMTGLKRGRVEAFSGSTVCNRGYRGMDSTSSSFITRAGRLGESDVILVCGATNDSWMNVPVGDYKESGWTKDDLYTFRPGLAKLFDELRRLYPKAKVYFILNSMLRPEINESVRTICAKRGVGLIELHGIAKQQGHPTVRGMQVFAAQVADRLAADGLVGELGPALTDVELRHPARDLGRTAAFFVDDVIWCLRDIARNRPKSIFDQPFLRMLKYGHDRYGLKTQLNLFYRTDSFYDEPEFSLADMPDAYKAEFQAAKDWLMFGPHAIQEFPDYPFVNASYAYTTNVVLKIRREVERFAGEGVFVQAMVAHWNTVSKEGCRALADCGIRLMAPNKGPRFAYDGDPSKLPYGHAFRLENNRQPETALFRRGSRNQAIDASVGGYGHFTVEQAKATCGNYNWYYDRTTGLGFKNYRNGPMLNLYPLEMVEGEFRKILKDPFVCFGMHEQYFYPDYLAYQEDYAQKVLLSAKILNENGYSFVFLDDTLDTKPEVSWSIMHPVDFDLPYMARIVEKAKEYGGVDSFELCGREQIGINGLSLFEPYPHASAKVDRAFVEKMRSDLNAIVRMAHDAGKPVYFWHRENLVPKGLFEDVPELLDADGEFDLLGAAYEKYLRFKIADTFRVCPELDGLVLTLTESEYSVIHNSNQEKYPAVQCVRKVVGIFTDELNRRGKRFILRSFGDGGDHDKIIDGALAAVKDKGHPFEIETKVTEADFVPWLPKNKYLKRDRPLALGAECDVHGEFLGAGYLPAAQVARICEYVASAREEGASRLALRIDRKGFSILDSAQEVNLYAYMRFIADPSLTVDAVLNEYAAKRFGAAAPALVPVLKNELEMVRCINYVASNLTFHAFPIQPNFKYVKAGGIFSLYREGASLAAKDAIWSIFSEQHAPSHAQILAEKDRGVALAEQGLAVVESQRAKLPADEYARQRRAFANAVVVAKLYREFARCIVAYFEEMAAGADEPKRLEAASAAALGTLESVRGTELDKKYLVGLEFFYRELPREYRLERTMRRALTRPDVYDFVIPGGIYDDIRVEALMHAAYAETKSDAIVCHAGNTRYPIGRITVRLTAPQDAKIVVDLDPSGAAECDLTKSWKDGVWTVSVGKKGHDYPAVRSIAAIRGN